MARKKTKLVWIQNDSARRATFRKRSQGLMKKVSELSTLCGVKACAIVYNPHEPTPEVWPPNNKEAMRVLNGFRSMPEMEQSKKMMNQLGFLCHRIAKAGDQLAKIRRENELASLMHQCMAGRALHDLSVEAVANLGWLLETKLKAVHQRIEDLRATTAEAVVAGNNDRAPPPPPLDGRLLPGELGSLDSALEVLKGQDMYIYSPQFPWPAEEATLHQCIDGVGVGVGVGGHVPTLHPDNNLSWLDIYFHA